jgi:hypothetical protein
MTYTIDNVPEDLDRALRAAAEAEHKSPEQTILDALARGLGLSEPAQKKRDLSGIAGARTIDEAARAEFAWQRQIDPELWK